MRLIDREHQSFDGTATDLNSRRAHCGQRGLGKTCERNIIESNYRNILRNLKAGGFEFLHRAKSHQVICYNHGCRQRLFCKYLARRQASAFEAKIALIYLWPRLFRQLASNSIGKCLPANSRRVNFVRTGDMRNFPMSQRNQMLYGLVNSTV
jgi:hypothetical protein